MNREEAYNSIDAIIAKYEIDEEPVTITSTLDYDALRIARKALEQEHCDDAISREDTLKAMIEQLGIRNEDYLIPAEETLYKVVKRMPPVNPQKCNNCEVGNPCIYCKHEFEPQEGSE